MKLYLDSANLEEIKNAIHIGIDGITTNPSLLAKENVNAEQILKLTDKPVSIEVTTTTTKEMVEEGLQITKLANNAVVKIPVSVEGLTATKILSDLGVKVNNTLIFSANQALMCAKADAFLVSIFVGRLDDIGHDGMLVVQDTLHVLKNYDTKVIVASVRHPLHVLNAAKIGAHVATVPYKILQQMTQHPLTDSGLTKFLDDYRQWKK